MAIETIPALSKAPIENTLHRWAMFISLFVFLVFPLGYFYQAYVQTSTQLAEQARFGSMMLKQVDFSTHPERDQRFKEALNLSPDSHVILTNTVGDEIYRSSFMEPRSPVMSERVNVIDDAHKWVATISVVRSTRPILYTSVGLTVMSAVLAWLVYFLFHSQPIRHLRDRQQNLSRAEKRLEGLEREKEKAVRQVRYSSETIRHLATHDLLTDLPNRPFLETRLREAIAASSEHEQPFALIMLDLNRFKEINDTLGHHCGDLVIREVSRRLREAAPNPDTIARIGGDEFGILASEVRTLDEAVAKANRILEALEKPYTFQGFSLDTSASLGVAMFPEHARDPDMLIQRADVAMYLAKGTNKDLVVYQSDIDPNSVSQLTLRGELRNTIEAGDLELYYQPKVDLRSNRVCGVEALVRWNHPERGMVSPVDFIPVAEQTGLIHPLTNLVFNKALHQASQWHAANRDLQVAVNLSVRSLHDLQLPQRINTLMQAWQIDPTMLVLEVTESAIMAEPERAQQVLRSLSDMGISISIDDFGTGYSSLAYIKQLPISEIKIDRTFVADMLNNENDSVIVRATIDMAHDLGLKVTAEGVENKETWELLLNYGCDHAQGFYLGRPQPSEKLDRWLLKSPWGIAQHLRVINNS